jgi:tetratricopeptide (TPR) repeat protein
MHTAAPGAGKKGAGNAPGNTPVPQMPYIILGVIIIVTLFVYMSSLKNDIMYGWDDGVYIEDPYVKNLTTESVGHFFSSWYLGMYQPLPVLTIALNSASGSGSALSYHLTNLFLHLVNIVLVFFLVRKMTGRLLPSAFTAALFAIHPMHVEAVAWISARSTLLFSVFYLLALIFYLRSMEYDRRKNLALTFLFFLLSAFSKSMSLTLPLVLFLLDYWKDRKIDRNAILEKLPFFAVSIIFGILSIRAAGSYGHITGLAGEYHIVDRFFLMTYALAFYIYKSFAPVILSGIHAFPFKEGGALPLMYYLSPLLIAAVVAVVIFLRKHQRIIIFGLLFFLSTVSLVLPFYWSRFFIVAERYSYLTYIGLYIILAYFFDRLFASEHLRTKKLRPYIAGFTLLVLILFSAASYVRTKAWKDARYLLGDVIIYNKSDASKAAAYFYRGNLRDMTRDFTGALKDYDMAIGKNPNYIIAYNNRGIIKGITGDQEGALADFSKAIELKPDYADAYYNRGLSNRQAGRMDEACNDWHKALSLGKAGARKFIERDCQ